jgi:voltage-gated potassium channel
MDMMLRTDNNLRVEEIPVPAAFAERAVSTLAGNREYLLVAIRDSSDRWNFNPAPADPVRAGDCLVAIVSPQGRRAMEAVLDKATHA